MKRSRPAGYTLIQLLLGYPLYWVCQVCGWGCACVIGQIPPLIDPSREPMPILHGVLLFFSLAGLSHFYRVFIQWNDWCSLNWRQLLPRGITASLTIAVTHVFMMNMFLSTDMTRIGAHELIPQAHFVFLTLPSFVLITAWSVLYFGYHFQVDYQKIQVNQLRLQVALREAEHRALSAQINPHFLFNSLNTLRLLIDENPEKAREAVTELARLFRASLKITRKNLITLREELETVQSYLSLEQARFEDRLVVHSDVPEATLEAQLPPFLLQTLIENAIKYGIGPQQSEISYRASLDANGLTLQVTNPGRIQVQSLRDSATGIGLENSRLRLQLLFGAKASLHLKSVQDNFVLAEALIPQLEMAA